MAFRQLTRSLFRSKLPQLALPSILSRPISSSAPASLPSLLRQCIRSFATCPQKPFLDDDLTSPQKPFLDGELWMTVMRQKNSDSRKEVTDLFTSTLAEVPGSQEEAITKIYSASTIYGWRFGSRISWDQANSLRANPEVLRVYRDRRFRVNDYWFEPYAPKSHGGRGPRWLGKKIDNEISKKELQAYQKRATNKFQRMLAGLSTVTERKWRASFCRLYKLIDKNLKQNCEYQLSLHMPRMHRPQQPHGDNERWLVFIANPKFFPSKDELISIYIEILAKVVGREQAKHRIYSIAISSYFFLGFGAYVPKHLLPKLKNLPEVGVGVRCVRPDTTH